MLLLSSDFNLDFALCGTQGLGQAFLNALLLGHEFWIAAEQNVGTAACHVGGDRDRAFAAGLGDDFRFASRAASHSGPSA